MKPVIRYKSQLLHRRSYKPNRSIKFRPAPGAGVVFRPSRAGPADIRDEYKHDRAMADVAFLD
jgi:hypothetical protein